MNLRTLSVALSFYGSLLVANAMAAPKYPHVDSIQGKVRWINKDKQEAKLRPQQVLIEQAALETGKDSQVVVELDPRRHLFLFPESRIELPSISWESGQAPIVILKYGSFRWQEEPGKDYNIALRSDLFEFISPVGDFIFSFDPKNASAEAKVIKGSMEFSALNGEEVALVTAGQRVQFQGVRENEEIVYDVLLKGKKIPRGKLGLVQPLSPEEKKLYLETELKVAKEKRIKKAAAAKKAIESHKTEGDICQSPWGKLNQCVWVCENNPKKEKKVCQLTLPEVRCLRKRCNANGEWAEATEVPKDKAQGLCAVQPVVKECDY